MGVSLTVMALGILACVVGLSVLASLNTSDSMLSKTFAAVAYWGGGGAAIIGFVWYLVLSIRRDRG